MVRREESPFEEPRKEVQVGRTNVFRNRVEEVKGWENIGGRDLLRVCVEIRRRGLGDGVAGKTIHKEIEIEKKEERRERQRKNRQSERFLRKKSGNLLRSLEAHDPSLEVLAATLNAYSRRSDRVQRRLGQVEPGGAESLCERERDLER